MSEPPPEPSTKPTKTDAPPLVDKLSDLWARARERKLVQWTIGYAVIAAGLLQFVALANDTLGWDGSLTRVALVIFLTGLPLVATLAWFHGDKGRNHVTKSEVAILSTLVALGLGGVLTVWLLPNRAQSVDTPVAQNIPGIGVSIAVLPFLADNPKDQDFAHGFADELLTTLGSIKGLRVPGRLSTFAATKSTGHELAGALQVNHLLEGAVRISGTEVQIRVRLINPKDDRVLWSNTYRRALNEASGGLYQVESDIARQVTSQLQVQLVAPDEILLNKIGTADIEAHRLYLIGTKALRARTLDNLAIAKTQFEEAINRDPNFAAPYAGLAQVHALLVGNFLQELPDGIRLGMEAAEKALKLDPNSGAALVSLAALKELRYVTADDLSLRDEAMAHIVKAVKLLPPNVADAKFWYGFILMYDKPDFVQARRWLEAALKSDSAYRMAELNSATMRWWVGDADIGRSGFRSMIEQYPDYSFAYLFLGWLELTNGRPAEALRLVRIAGEKSNDPILPYRRWQIAMNLGDMTEAATALNNLGGSQFHNHLRQAMKHAASGDFRAELAVLEKARNAGEDGGRLGYAAGLLHHALGDPARAAQILVERFPGIATKGEAVNFFNMDAALALAAAWKSSGQNVNAGQLLRRIAAYLSGPTMPKLSSVEVWRAMALAIEGNNDAAIAKLNEAYDSGFRMIWFDREVRTWHFQYVPLPLDFDPRWGALRTDARFKSFIERIKKSNAAE